MSESETRVETVVDPMIPKPWLVKDVIAETADTFTLVLEPENSSDFPNGFNFLPGQFNMMYVFGIGEVPISISSDPKAKNRISHTTRIVGSVTKVMGNLEIGDAIGIRGPYGRGWPIDLAQGKDVIIVAGGIGLAPMRPAMYHFLHNRNDYNRVSLLYGARTHDDLLYRGQLESWSSRLDVEILVTLDRSSPDWYGSVGVVTQLIQRAPADPDNSIILICGPEIMMKYCLPELYNRGIPNERIYVSLERNMKCAIGHCGHCQYGPEFVCKSGPVYPMDQVVRLMNIEEL